MAPADGTPLLVSICLLSASGGGYNLADDADAIRESYHIVDTHQRYQGIQNYLIKPVAAAPSRSNMTDARQETPDANNLGGTCYYEDKSAARVNRWVAISGLNSLRQTLDSLSRLAGHESNGIKLLENAAGKCAIIFC